MHRQGGGGVILCVVLPLQYISFLWQSLFLTTQPTQAVVGAFCKPGRVTIAGHANDDLAPGTLNSILKQAKMKEGR
jgi:hypothetical protein